MSETAVDIDTELQVINALGLSFYEAVPADYQTYCALNSQVAQRVLQRLSIPSEVIPCQLWYVAPGQNCVIGFVGKGNAEHTWDGHAICATPRFFVDTALHHVQRDFGVKVPRVIAGSRFELPTQAIARFDLSETQRLWWYHAPPNAEKPPQEPRDIVERLADALLARVQQRLANA